MTIEFEQYLGVHFDRVLELDFLKKWRFKKSVDDDSGCIVVMIEFPKHGFDMLCDADGAINTIFVDFSKFPSNIEVKGIGRSDSRSDLRERFGKPVVSHPALQHNIFGSLGAWDRFDYSDRALHIEYSTSRDVPAKITWMRADVAPKLD